MKTSVVGHLANLVRYNLGSAAIRAKMQFEWLQTQGAITQNMPSGATPPRVNQMIQSLIERDDVNLATCVRIISDSLAWLPLKVMYQESDSKGNLVLTPDNDHWFNSFWRKPHPQHTTSEIKKHCAASLLTTGNAYLARMENPEKPSRRRRQIDPTSQIIKPKPSSKMFAKLDKDKENILEYTERLQMAQERTWPIDQVVHMRLYNINDPIYGRSGVEPLKRALWTEYQAEMMQLAHFASDGTPRTVFSPKESVGVDQQKQIEEFYRNRTDPEDKNRLQITPVPGEFHVVQPTMKDMEFGDMRRFHRERTFSLIGIPPFLGGVMEYANYANAAIQEASFWRHTMIPLCFLVTDFLTRQLLWRLEDDENYQLMFDVSGVEALRADGLKQAKIAVAVAGGPVLTPNEARARFYDAEPIEGGDELRSGAAGFSITPNDGSEQANNEDDDKNNSPMVAQIKSLGIAMPGEVLSKMHRTRQLERKVAIRTRDATGTVVHEAEVDESIFQKARDDMEEWIDKNESRIIKPMKTYWTGLHDRVQDALDEATVNGSYMTGLYAIVSKADIDPNNLDGFMNMQAEKELLAKLFEPIVLELFSEVGENATSEAIGAGGVGIAFNVQNPKIQEAVYNRLNNITRTTDTTFRDIKKILLNAYRNGLSIHDAAKLITGKFHQYAITRSTLIARTEMTGLANSASRLAWQANGATHKIWVATFDSRTRDYHVMYNGERAKIDAYFVFGPEPLFEPGDTNAQLAANVCNCRCGMIYDFDPVDYLTDNPQELEANA